MRNDQLDLAQLYEDGYVVFPFNSTETLNKMQSLCEANACPNMPDWHLEDISTEAHVLKVRSLSEVLYESGLIELLLKENLHTLIPILGPDIDIQRHPHLRISRPSLESDLIDWHRDTFYGNTPWELNLWFPVYPLQPKAGLCISPGSHKIPSTNIRDKVETEPFRQSVTKGSIANKVGYLYRAKTDDFISNLDESKTKLIRPTFGSAILFFGSSVHRAQNLSQKTRVTLDLRIRSMHIPTNCKPGYYQSLSRGVVQQAASAYFKALDTMQK